MGFEYFKALLDFNGHSFSMALRQGSFPGRNTEYWTGAFITAAMIAFDSCPDEAELYFMEMIKTLREDGENGEADLVQKWVDKQAALSHDFNKKRRH